ncbi:MAG TPA: TldD/PmbA family protein, partial [Candidatus Deferrimicrobium sp.]|nr:TldD/PmbA family protein [Candidatus Deferrimicrobium sp.]
MDKSVNYIDCGKKCLKLAERKGADIAEIYITNLRSISAEIEKGSMKNAQEVRDHGISIRIVKDRSIAFSFSTDFEWNNLEKMVLTALQLSKTGVSDPDFIDFPHPTSYPTITGLFDKRIAALDVNTAMDYCLRSLSAAQIDPRINSVNVNFACGTVERILMNTNEINVSSEETGIQLSCEIAAKDNSDSSSGFEFQVSRFLEIDPEFIGKASAELALKSLHAQIVETNTYPVIFHPFAVATIFSSAIGTATNAEAVQYKRSYLTNKKGEEIAVNFLEVIDNGLYMSNERSAGLGTSKCDGEGVPRQKTPIISKGILENYLYDTYTAGKANCQSTGNAARSTYRSTLSIAISNLQLLGQSGDLDSFISEMENGILVYYTADRPTIATGDFSGLIGIGFKIENGTIAYPLKNT